jgi:outer membrane lipoprotein SlyB
MVEYMSYVNISDAKGVKKLSRMKMCGKVSVEYTGPKPFTFLGTAVLGGLGVVFGALRGGVLGAIVLSMLGATIGAIIGYATDTVFEALIRLMYQGLEVTMNYGNQG